MGANPGAGNRLVHRFGALSQLGGEMRPGIVHRLDKDTSGVLLVARADAAHRALAAQFAGRTVEKIYLALVHGKVRADLGRITKPIARDPVRRTRMTARLGFRTRGADRIRRAAAIRKVHVSGSAHRHRADAPDPRASGEHRASGGGRLRVSGRRPHKELFLHAWRIGFVSPATGEKVTVEAPLPPELANWLAGL